MLMLSLAKNYEASKQDLRAGVICRSFGRELAGRTLGLVGVGASGRKLARLLRRSGCAPSASTQWISARLLLMSWESSFSRLRHLPGTVLNLRFCLPYTLTVETKGLISRVILE